MSRLESEFPSLANLVVVFAPLCRLLEIALPLTFRLSTDCGRRHFGRDSTVVIHLSGLKSVTTDNQERGALTSRSVATGLPTIRWADHSGCHAGAQWDVSIA